MISDEQAIRQLVDTWMAASKAGDTQKVLSLMTDDALFIVPGREPFGKAEFAAASKAMGGAKIDGSSRIVELQVHGEWAFLRNHIKISITPPNGETTMRYAQTLTLLKKVNGQWLLARDANLPAPEEK